MPPYTPQQCPHATDHPSMMDDFSPYVYIWDYWSFTGFVRFQRDCECHAARKSSMHAEVCQFSANDHPSVVCSGDRDPWPGWPAAWHVGPVLPCITLYYPVTLHYLRGMLALHYPGGKRRLASLLPGCSVTHRLSFRRMQAKAAPVNLRRGRHIGGRGVTGVGKGWRLYMASLPACTSHGNT